MSAILPAAKNDDAPAIRIAATTGQPDLAELAESYQRAINRRDSALLRRQRLNYRARYCVWPGQSEDGRKWSPKSGEDDVFPWKGASDIEARCVDGWVRYATARLKTVWRRNRIQVSTMDVNDLKKSARLTEALRWMRYTQMDEMATERDLLANWFTERGNAVAGIFWKRESALGYEDVDLESIRTLATRARLQLAMNGGGGDPRLERLALADTLVLDPSMEAAAGELVREFYPDLSAARARQVARDIRETGTARFPRPYLRVDRPCLMALAPGEDFFLEDEPTDLQLSRGPFWRELVTETTLRERAKSNDWDERAIAECIETQRGRLSGALEGVFPGRFRARPGGAQPDTSRLFEIVHAYRRQGDAEGVPGIYYTCFNPGLTQKNSTRHHPGQFYHGPLNYDHGKYPFVLFQAEKLNRLLLDARGYGELGGHWQDSIKSGFDSRRDRAGINTLPPLYHPPGQPPAKWCPGYKIGTRNPTQFGYFQPAAHDRTSEEIEETIWKHAQWFFGHVTDPLNAPDAAILQQAQADDWMECWQAVDTQILQLMQQFMPDEFYYRVVGSSKGEPLRATREEIQGQFDVAISYNVGNFDPEKIKQTVAILEKMLEFNQNSGRMDFGAVLEVLAELADPNLGERVILPGEHAATAEIKDEANALTLALNGIDAPVVPGMAFQQRLQWLQQQLQQNPTVQKRATEDENVKRAVETRFKRLTHQVQQFGQNAEIGRQGA